MPSVESGRHLSKHPADNFLTTHCICQLLTLSRKNNMNCDSHQLAKEPSIYNSYGIIDMIFWIFCFVILNTSDIHFSTMDHVKLRLKSSPGCWPPWGLPPIPTRSQCSCSRMRHWPHTCTGSSEQSYQCSTWWFSEAHTTYKSNFFPGASTWCSTAKLSGSSLQWRDWLWRENYLIRRKGGAGRARRLRGAQDDWGERSNKIQEQWEEGFTQLMAWVGTIN